MNAIRRRRSKAGREAEQGLTREALARALDRSLSAVDRLIAAGLKPCGKAGRANLYDPKTARAIDQARSSRVTEYGGSLVDLLHAQTCEAIDRRYELESTFVSPDAWQPAWERAAGADLRFMRGWPAALEAAFSRRDDQVLGGDDPVRRAVRPLLTALASRESGLALARVLVVPPPPGQPAKPDTIAGAKAALISARAAAVQLRLQVRRERWRRREDVVWVIEDAIARVRQIWWNGLPGRLLTARDQTAADWRQAALEALEDTRGALQLQRLRWRR